VGQALSIRRRFQCYHSTSSNPPTGSSALHQEPRHRRVSTRTRWRTCGCTRLRGVLARQDLLGHPPQLSTSPPPPPDLSVTSTPRHRHQRYRTPSIAREDHGWSVLRGAEAQRAPDVVLDRGREDGHRYGDDPVFDDDEVDLVLVQVGAHFGELTLTDGGSRASLTMAAELH